MWRRGTDATFSYILEGHQGQTGRFLTFGGEQSAPDYSVHCFFLMPRKLGNPL